MKKKLEEWHTETEKDQEPEKEHTEKESEAVKDGHC